MFGAATSFVIYYFTAPQSVAMDFPKNLNGWISVILLATVATVIPTATLYAGMKLIGTGKTAVLQTFEPVSSIVAGVIFLGEPLTLARIVGAIFVIGAVGSLAASETRNKASIPH
jgi:drug/metabolite transporter (DMT)-like permease